MKKVTVTNHKDKYTKVYNILDINLQQSIVLTETGTSILAGVSRHNNKIVFNKPLLMGTDKQDIQQMLEECAYISPYADINIEYTDSYGINCYDNSTGGNKSI